jgi:hypothetical protein
VAASRSADRPSKLGRVLRTVFWALVFAFVFGFVVGTLLRRELDRPVRYIGERSDADSVMAANPYDVGNTLTGVLVPRHHEEQI